APAVGGRRRTARQGTTRAGSAPAAPAHDQAESAPRPRRLPTRHGCRRVGAAQGRRTGRRTGATLRGRRGRRTSGALPGDSALLDVAIRAALAGRLLGLLVADGEVVGPERDAGAGRADGAV